MKLRDNIQHQCAIYIHAVLSGMDGEQMRYHSHLKFIGCLPYDVDPGFLLPILHNLDKEIGFNTKGIDGKDIPDSQRRIWAKRLFKLLWEIYKDEEQP